MSDGHRPGPDSSATDPEGLARPARRELLAAAARVGLVTVVATSGYALAPLGRRPDAAIAVRLAGWLLVLAAVVAWQVRAIMRSDHPGLRAGEAIAVSVPLLLVLFASTYFVTGRLSAASFTQPLTRIDAMYFTITVFTTVGFGDISPSSEQARMLVSAQMITDLLLIGFVAKVFLGAIQRRRQALALNRDTTKID